MFEFIAAHIWVYLLLVIILSLAVGSFLNVVIHRLPLMLENDWRKQCLDSLEETDTEEKSIAEKRFDLLFPASHCPSCLVKLSIWQNIPVLSYILLQGRCAHCQTKIPFRYLMVELLSAFFSTIVAIQFGLTIELLPILLLTWFLITLSFIDLENKILPDILTIPLLWLGLIVSCFNILTNSHDAILGAIFGYAFLWAINAIFKLITKKEGMGQGDFKLLATCGAWLGWQLLPFVILTSSIMGLLIGGGILLLQGKSRKTPIPFGPFIALSLWIGSMWGYDFTQSYFHWFGLTWENI